MKFIGTITQKRRSTAPFATLHRLDDTMVFLPAKVASVFSTERCVISCHTVANLLGTAASIGKTERNVNIADFRSA